MFIPLSSSIFKNIEVIFENNDFIIVNKPHGMSVIRGRNRIDDVLLYDALLTKYKDLFLVHRLDASAAGLMVFAKNKTFCSFLTEQFEKHKIIKKYLCICDGILDAPKTVMLPISKRNYRGKYKINFKSGTKAITSFFPLGRNKEKSLILAMPITGRTHQIRLHLKSIGVPIIDDYLYNKKHSKETLTRISLFAFSLQFDNFIFETKVSSYFYYMASECGLENRLKQFFEKRI
jgi:RluA family pseudouridine synthase